MTKDEGKGDENNEEFLRMFREFLEGSGSFDFSELAGAAGLSVDPVLVNQMMSQLRAAMDSSPEAAAESATQRATVVAAAQQIPITDEERSAAANAFQIASLWLSDQTTLVEQAETGRVINRVEWTRGSIEAWRQIAEPISDSIGDTLVAALADQAPEAMGGAVSGATQMLRRLGKTLFSLQLGQAVGQLSQEVVSATEIGVPLFADGHAALVPQNVTEFARDLDIPIEEVNIFLATRELAHTGLFHNARWLSLHLTTAIREYAQGLSIDLERMRDAVQSLDLSDTAALKAAIDSGALLAPPTEAQIAALARIETLYALIEGWVDVVTADATVRLPKAPALRETMTRRRAAGGPAEQAFGALVGLKLRPRRLREAAAMWRLVGEKLDVETRDALWQHPDLVPTGDDISDPEALIHRLKNPAAPDEMDRDLERLLTGGFDDTEATAAEASDQKETDEPGKPDDSTGGKKPKDGSTGPDDGPIMI